LPVLVYNIIHVLQDMDHRVDIILPLSPLTSHEVHSPLLQLSDIPVSIRFFCAVVREDKDDPTSCHGRNRHACLIYTKQTTGTGRLDIVRFESSLWDALGDRHGRNRCGDGCSNDEVASESGLRPRRRGQLP
jgi:hypothetical protein